MARPSYHFYCLISALDGEPGATKCLHLKQVNMIIGTYINNVMMINKFPSVVYASGKAFNHQMFLG